MHTYNKQGIGRFYATPRGDYPSVTTVLSADGDKTWLDEWRKNVGSENADRIVKESTDIGSHLHYLFECLLQNIKANEPKTPEEAKAEKMFKIAKPKLLKIVDKVLYMEEPVWSDSFRIAGRFDMLCKTKEGKIALVDYKNTKRNKTREDVESYRKQLAFYVKMIKDTLGIDVEEQKIFMVNREGFVQIFNFYEKDTPRSELVAIRKNFWDKFGY